MDDRYREYLQSDWWAKTRQKVIERVGNKCECCGRPFDLQVHHLSYEHLGFERENELMCLCTNCHKWIEEQKHNYHIFDPEQQRQLLEIRRDNLLSGNNHPVKTRQEIVREFIREYDSQDYYKLGDLNMTQIDTIKAEFRKFCKAHNYDPKTHLRVTTVQDYFRNRRIEVILRYMERGAEPYIVKQQTKISHSMIDKYYKNPQQARRMLEREEEI